MSLSLSVETQSPPASKSLNSIMPSFNASNSFQTILLCRTLAKISSHLSSSFDIMLSSHFLITATSLKHGNKVFRKISKAYSYYIDNVGWWRSHRYIRPESKQKNIWVHFLEQGIGWILSNWPGRGRLETLDDGEAISWWIQCMLVIKIR